MRVFADLARFFFFHMKILSFSCGVANRLCKHSVKWPGVVFAFHIFPAIPSKTAHNLAHVKFKSESLTLMNRRFSRRFFILTSSYEAASSMIIHKNPPPEQSHDVSDEFPIHIIGERRSEPQWKCENSTSNVENPTRTVRRSWRQMMKIESDLALLKPMRKDCSVYRVI